MHKWKHRGIFIDVEVENASDEFDANDEVCFYGSF